MLLTNAWVVDDAYITFRTVDNWTHGYGLTWNPGERVQAYTHPLWMFLVSFFYFFTSELFFTSILLSFALTLMAVELARRLTGRITGLRWKETLLLLGLLSCKAFIDYASSGLENAFSYLLIAIFLRILFTFPAAQVTGDRLILPFFVAALAFVNRQDTLILYLPALIYLLYRSGISLRILVAVFCATLPATLWSLFSLFYYGSIFPNTAYAKAIATGFPLQWKILRGYEYFSNSLSWDTAAYGMLLLAVWYGLRSRKPAVLAILAGVFFYLLFVLVSGASSTHMSGRFMALPLFIGIVLCVQGISNIRQGMTLGICLIAYIIWSPVSSIKFGTEAYVPYEQNANFIDTKWYVFNEGAALLNWERGKAMPDHAWYHAGETLRAEPQKVHLGGADGGEAIGYVGFAAGPETHFIDVVALSDPLLSRLPAVQPEFIEDWKSGHYHRLVPEGYLESLEAAANLIQDPNIHAYYEKVLMITRGPLWSMQRLKAIWEMNRGKYQYLLDGTDSFAP